MTPEKMQKLIDDVVFRSYIIPLPLLPMDKVMAILDEELKKSLEESAQLYYARRLDNG
jgi:hypothetical protein